MVTLLARSQAGGSKRWEPSLCWAAEKEAGESLGPFRLLGKSLSQDPLSEEVSKPTLGVHPHSSSSGKLADPPLLTPELEISHYPPEGLENNVAIWLPFHLHLYRAQQFISGACRTCTAKAYC